jgi:hypothetical protein
MLEDLERQGPISKRLRRSSQPVKYDMDNLNDKEL